MLKKKFIPSPLENTGQPTRPPAAPIRTWRVLFVAWLVARVVWWVWRMRLSNSKHPHGGQWTPLELGKLVRQELERLGGLWVKMAHVIGARRDVFSASFCDELVQTREWTVGCSGDEAKKVVHHELGHLVDEMFREFDVVPIATTPMSQIHVAWLRNREVKVAIKIQRPGIHRAFASDLDIIRKLSTFLQFFYFRARVQISEMRTGIENVFALELDYRHEAKAMRTMRRNLVTMTNDVYVPKIFSRFCSPRVLVMEFVDGVLLSDYREAVAMTPKKTKKWCRDNGIQPRKLLPRLTHGELVPILSGRLSRGLQPGNIMMLRKNRVAFIDFGALGLLDEESPCVGNRLMQESSRIFTSHCT